MDKKKAEEAMTKLKIAIRIKKEEIKNNKILFPKHDNSRLEEDIEVYETAIEALEKEIIRSCMDESTCKALDDLVNRKMLKDEITSLRITFTGMRNGKTMAAQALEEYRKSVLRIIDEQPSCCHFQN